MKKTQPTDQSGKETKTPHTYWRDDVDAGTNEPKIDKVKAELKILKIFIKDSQATRGTKEKK